MVDNVWDDFFKKIPDTDPDQYSFDFNDNMATSTSVPKIDLTDSNITWTSNTFSGNITYPYTIPNTGSTNLNWQPLLTVGTTTTSHPFQVNGNSVVFDGDGEFKGDVKIKGKSIAEALNKIEERLAILHPNERLEEKWEKLKELGDAYRALEADIIEKEKIWDALKR